MDIKQSCSLEVSMMQFEQNAKTPAEKRRMTGVFDSKVNSSLKAIPLQTALIMSLEGAFARLSLRPSMVCRQCRRTFASSTAIRQQQQSATGALSANLARAQTASKRPPTASRTPSTLPVADQPPTATTPNTPSAPVKPGQTELAMSTVRDLAAHTRSRQATENMAALASNYNLKDLEKGVTRRWRVGDVYAPHDLSGVEAAKWKKLRRKGKMRTDVVDLLGIRPVDYYKNFTMMSEYMSDMGRIKHRNETSLRPVNQRRMAKAVRRAIGTGLMPGVHRHPEILKMEMRNRNMQS